MELDASVTVPKDVQQFFQAVLWINRAVNETICYIFEPTISNSLSLISAESPAKLLTTLSACSLTLGLAVFASCVILALTTMNVWLMHRLRERTVDRALSGYEGWDEVWRYGGVSLRRTGQELETTGPAQDWRPFARSLPTAARYEE